MEHRDLAWSFLPKVLNWVSSEPGDEDQDSIFSCLPT